MQKLKILLLSLLIAVTVTIHGNSQDVNITYPANAGILDVTAAPYNADKTGVTDATIAIQTAINNSASDQIVYFPNGTYKISNTLTTPRKNRVFIQGQSKSGTVIKLSDNNPLFAAGSAKKMLIIGEPNHGQSFFNEVRNLTFNGGSGNPGTYAVHFAANNMGCVRHIKITSDDGQGAIGLDLLAGTNGPALIYDVTVQGYDIGIKNWAFHSIILEKIVVENQNQVGIWNQGNGFTIRNLTSNNTVKAIENKQTMLLIDANLTGGNSSNPAILSSGTMYARNVTQAGYDKVIESTSGNQNDAAGTYVDEFTSQNPRIIMPSPARSLHLPIKEIPEVAWGNPNSFDWGNVADYLLPENGSDITLALQAAIDAGHKTVYIPKNINGGNAVNLTGTVYIRNNCERLISLGASFGFNDPGKIEVIDGNANTVIIERLRGAYTKIEYTINTSRTVVMSSMPTGFNSVPVASNGSGDLHIVDIAGHFRFNNPNQNIWCRQINPEGDFVGIINKGANLWILGIKTEGGETKIRTSDSGKTELLGGQVFTNVPFSRLNGTNGSLVENVFEIDNASFSFAGIHRRLANTDRSPFNHWVKETRGSETRYLDINPSTYDEPIALFAGYLGETNTPPLAPTAIGASAVGFRVDLTWTDNSNDELAFEIQRATDNAFTENIKYFVRAKNDTSYSNIGLEVETNYYYRIRALNEGAYSGWSAAISASTGSLGSGSGLRGEYWNRAANGYNFVGSSNLIKIDEQINFDWGNGSIGAPEDTTIQVNYVTVRWTGQFEPYYTEEYTISTLTDDGVRLWINNKLVVDKWFTQSGENKSTPILLTAGQKYNIKLEYFEGGGAAKAKLYWQSASQAKEIIPSSQLFSVIGPEEFAIISNTGLNGSITPAGTLNLEEGVNQTYTFSPNAGYAINNVWVDGISIGAISTYTFANLSANHTIYVNFRDELPQGPYGGSPWPINNGAVIEAENYDIGGQHISYFDKTPGNTGVQYRDDDVDVEISSDSLGGFNIAWTNSGEWLEYTTNVTSGVYNIGVRVASKENPGDLQISLDGNVLGVVNVTSTGEWQAWETFTLDSVSIPGGSNKVLRVEFVNGGNINFNKIIFTSVSAAVQRTITATTGANGTISPSGNIVIDEGGNQTLTITPNSGFVIQDVLVDGISVGAVSSYTFNNVVANHTITATFTAAITTLPNVTIASYLFNASLNSSDTDPNTNAGNFTDGPGIIGGTSYFGGGRTVNQTVLTKFIGNSIANEDYFEFTVTPGPAASMDLTTLTFNVKRAGTSPDKLRVYSSADNYSAYKEISISGSWIAHSWDLTNFETLTEAVTFRFYVFGNNSGGADPTRIVYIDNVTLTGDVLVSNSSASLRRSSVNSDFPFENHNESSNGIMVYPNPVGNGTVTIDGLSKNAVVTIYSSVGVKLFQQQAVNQLLEIPVYGITSSGIIFISVNQNNTITWHKVIVE